VSVIRERQAAVAELTPRLDLREEMALLGDDVRAGGDVDRDQLAGWGEAPTAPAPAALRVGVGALGLASLGAAIAWLNGASPLWLLAIGGAGQAVAWALRQRTREAIVGVERARRGLELLSALLARIEREPVESPRLSALRNALFAAGGAPPSRQIARLELLVGLWDLQGNQFFAPIAIVLLWRTQIGLALAAWRSANGAAIDAGSRRSRNGKRCCRWPATRSSVPRTRSPTCSRTARRVSRRRPCGTPSSARPPWPMTSVWAAPTPRS
jgi:hypothetical protein